MSYYRMAIVAGALAAVPANARDDAPALPDSASDHARSAVENALAEKTALPVTPPTLPEQASDRAREVHSTIAFGAKGAQTRAAHVAADHAAKSAVAASARDAAGDKGASVRQQNGQSDRGHGSARPAVTPPVTPPAGPPVNVPGVGRR